MHGVRTYFPYHIVSGEERRYNWDSRVRIASREILPGGKKMTRFWPERGGSLKEGPIFPPFGSGHDTGVTSPEREEEDLS
jgi:hypothetical protein